MRQAVMTKPGEIQFGEVPVPEIGPDEVLIRVRRIGVCGSDIHVNHGLHPYTTYPVVQGHEVSGVIDRLGAAVRGFTVGQQVTFMPQLFCGECHPCRSGNYHICDQLRVMGFQAPGAAQDYFAVSASAVIALPPELSIDVGAMVEPLAVACHALRRAGGAQGRKVVVVGAGPIGNLIAQVAMAQGAADVLISDVSEFRLQVASACGIPHTSVAAQEKLIDAVRRCFGRDGADLILDCVGAEAATTQAILAARKGSTIVVVGVFGKKPVVDLGLVQDRELSLVGTLMYQRPDYEEAVRIAASGRLNLDGLVTNRFRFEDYLKAYHFIDQAGEKAMKVLISLDEEN